MQDPTSGSGVPGNAAPTQADPSGLTQTDLDLFLLNADGSVLEEPISEPGAPTDGEPSPVEPSGPPEAKQDPSRFEYWQRQAALNQRAAEEYQAQLDQFKQVVPVLQIIQQDEELQRAIEARMKGSVAAPQGMPNAAPISAPQKPSNYDPVAAYNDPSSESFKFREAQDQYRDRLLMTFMEREQQREQQAIEQARQTQRNAAIQHKLVGIRNELITKYGFKPERANHLVQTMSNDASLTLDNIVKAYNAIYGTQAPAQPQGPARPQNPFGPPPVSQPSGQGEPGLDVQDEFNQALLQHRNIRRPA